MPLISPAGMSYTDWRFEMLRAHDGAVDVSRARFEALTAPPSVADLEAEMSRAKAAIASIRDDIRDHLKIRRVALRDKLVTPRSSIGPGGEPWAPIYARYIRERIALLRRHQLRVDSFRAQISAIEGRQADDVAEVTLRRDLPVLALRAAE